ncbi:MAG: hypothetical protein A3I26_02940 [Candidatus Yanofskybacteria bacterium RIFCSPLOWO2_02_FULL_43_10]|uniref:Uncharacterized protein n=2 Tax=Parcubacteria group TaxID=1794811 RepID=A0A1G2RPR1_9BACT|nr:MAG: hypothetical protein A2742_02120 [Candidatus Yanofskybacteria bacterium RIFCSPHIGHO2_01_FULL_43_32]OGN11801.1 MAG: hypothetical protein A3C69_00355 [Candidatus Yanofskybacteria bacterium RIFCSPHIGHO2_02_FULL_43_12]OGN17053.1 MAG: hypothetical protein A3E34_01770 [Candidatus Yanofskybacteria bacterium RIFCSPHIGHO2_12_FULL_43_11]OGN30885.1 MAG: hypothetical protein A3I26_02940 [Candidatus Yanofskybacteria bacterium RIFCSPLOWO2_02_FULL_43_10]OGN34418.1 MAG: hypothetical protein A3G51_03460
MEISPDKIQRLIDHRLKKYGEILTPEEAKEDLESGVRLFGWLLKYDRKQNVENPKVKKADDTEGLVL